MHSLLPLLLALIPAVDAPLVGRPREYFYGAVGEQVRISLRAAPTELRAEDPLVLTLTITGAANPEQIEQPDLRQLPEFAERFHIDDLPDHGPPQAERRFRYRMRPKNDKVRDVPPLLFHYYDPRLNYFATTATPEAIVLKVTSRDAADAVGLPLDVPDFLLGDPTTRTRWHDRRASSSLTVDLLVALFVPPLFVAAWYVWWKRRRPDAARLALLRRTRAVREALDMIESLRDPSAPRFADRAAAAVLGYLQERLALPRSVATPPEIAAHLAHSSVRPELVGAAAEFFRQCDASRFGPPDERRADLPDSARRLILVLEESA